MLGFFGTLKLDRYTRILSYEPSLLGYLDQEIPFI